MGVTRRQRPDHRPSKARPSPILPLTLTAIVIGAVSVLVYAAVTGAPAGGGDVQAAGHQPPPMALVEGRTVGQADAPVTVEIWSDFQCPACGILALEVEPRLISEYVVPGTARLVYRDFAFLGDGSLAAAVAARSAAASGRFWAYHDLLFANQDGENRGAFAGARLLAIAEAAGVPRETVSAALVDPVVRGVVRDETAEGRRLGVSSTAPRSYDGGGGRCSPYGRRTAWDWPASPSWCGSRTSSSSSSAPSASGAWLMPSPSPSAGWPRWAH